MSPRKKQARVGSPEDPQHNNGGNTIVLELPDGEVGRANANHHVRLHAALAVLSACDLLADISTESPLNMAAKNLAEASGLQAPFAQGSYDASMSKNSEYTAGINIFWHDWNYTAIPGIPLRSNAVDALLEHYFQTPARFPGMLYISVPSPTYAPLEHKGALQSVSPEEIRAAFSIAFARDVAAGAPESVVREWIKSSLSCTATFVVDATPPQKNTSGHVKCVKTWRRTTMPWPAQPCSKYTKLSFPGPIHAGARHQR
jgi:hypothetical protein